MVTRVWHNPFKGSLAKPWHSLGGKIFVQGTHEPHMPVPRPPPADPWPGCPLTSSTWVCGVSPTWPGGRRLPLLLSQFCVSTASASARLTWIPGVTPASPPGGSEASEPLPLPRPLAAAQLVLPGQGPHGRDEGHPGTHTPPPPLPNAMRSSFPQPGLAWTSAAPQLCSPRSVPATPAFSRSPEALGLCSFPHDCHLGHLPQRLPWLLPSTFPIRHQCHFLREACPDHLVTSRSYCTSLFYSLHGP